MATDPGGAQRPLGEPYAARSEWLEARRAVSWMRDELHQRIRIGDQDEHGGHGRPHAEAVPDRGLGFGLSGTANSMAGGSMRRPLIHVATTTTAYARAHGLFRSPEATRERFELRPIVCRLSVGFRTKSVGATPGLLATMGRRVDGHAGLID